jgi:purine-binding chemotaxis protein CheW
MTTTSHQSLVVIVLDGQRHALRLAAVERITRMVEITSLPAAPLAVIGIANVQGRILPVYDLRRRFGLPQRNITLTDWLIIARTARRPVALIADAVIEVIACAESDLIAAENILSGVEAIEGVVRLKDGLILIHSLDKFLSLEEQQSLDRVLDHV